jgi:hypothetical protein
VVAPGSQIAGASSGGRPSQSTACFESWIPRKIGANGPFCLQVFEQAEVDLQLGSSTDLRILAEEGEGDVSPPTERLP